MLPHLQWVLFLRFFFDFTPPALDFRFFDFDFNAFCWLRSSISGRSVSRTCLFQHSTQRIGRVTLSAQSSWSCGNADRHSKGFLQPTHLVLLVYMETGGTAEFDFFVWEHSASSASSILLFLRTGHAATSLFSSKVNFFLTWTCKACVDDHLIVIQNHRRK